MIFPARSTLFDDENVFRFLSVGVPRSMEERPTEKSFSIVVRQQAEGLVVGQNSSCKNKRIVRGK